jgi:hypothetical protein
VEVREANADPKISVLKVFYNIWGVGAATAREFYRKGEFHKVFANHYEY